MLELPIFKYFPNPIKLGSISKSNITCECCKTNRGYIYSASMYTSFNVENICPWCIADGTAAEKFSGTFNNFGCDIDSDIISHNTTEEVMKRTPGFSTYQEENWQTHCDDACELLGLATAKDFKNISNSEKDRIVNNSYLDDSEFKYLQELDSNIELDEFFKFRCLHCGELRFMLDLD